MKKLSKKVIRIADLKEVFAKKDKVDKLIMTSKKGNEKMGNGGNCSCNRCSA